jgi:serine/threonine-protein kinase
MTLMVQTSLHNGKYVLDTRMGKGIFEATYQATNNESGQIVVIKTLGEALHHHADFDEFKQQFIDFAARLSHCQHPHLVRVLDLFEEKGVPYLVMEFIPGLTLAELIQVNVLSEHQATAYIRQISDGLSKLHQVGLLHQDIKPENIIQRQDTLSVVLCEFGMTLSFVPGVMQTHASLLSSGYAPPEQYAFEEQRTQATDIYALAATFYCLLTGSPPLPASVRGVLQGLGSGSQEPQLFSPKGQQPQPNLSPVIKQVIWRGLELTSQRRPQTVEEWLALFPTLKKSPAVELPAVTQRNSVKPKTIKKIEPNSLKSKTSQAPTKQKNSTSQPELTQNLATELKIAHHSTVSLGTKPNKSKRRSLLPALLITGAIAAAAGVGFGVALRMNGPNGPGSTLLHTEQSFPPTSNWPMSQPRL